MLCVWPAAGAGIIFCPLYGLTGLYCPGCGSMRAIGALLSGHIAEAFRYNPVTAPLLPLLALVCLCWLVGYVIRGEDVILYRIPFWLYMTVLGLLFLFGLLRNIPAAIFDCLRPGENYVFAGGTAFALSPFGLPGGQMPKEWAAAVHAALAHLI